MALYKYKVDLPVIGLYKEEVYVPAPVMGLYDDSDKLKLIELQRQGLELNVSDMYAA